VVEEEEEEEEEKKMKKTSGILEHVSAERASYNQRERLKILRNLPKQKPAH
jgi:hypothetical protein